MVERLRGVGGMRRGRGTVDVDDVVGFWGLAGRDDSAERADDWRERDGGDIRPLELPFGRCPGLVGPGEGGDMGLLVRLVLAPRLGGISIDLMRVARMNIPCLGLHVKYTSPSTEPSFLPLGSESSTPIHRPGANLVVPLYLTIPFPA